MPPPVRLTVQAATPLPAQPAPRDSLLPGLVLKLANQRIVPVQDTRDQGWLVANGVGPDQPYVFQAYFEVPDQAVYQFQLWHFGQLQLAVDGRTLFRGNDGKYEQKFVPVSLAAGLHRLTVAGKAGQDVRLRILFGGRGTQSLSGQIFKHPKR